MGVLPKDVSQLAVHGGEARSYQLAQCVAAE